MTHLPVDSKPSFQDCFPRFPAHARILDVGCGIGDLTSEMAQYVPQGSVLGVDICLGSIVSRNCLHLVQVPGLAFPAIARNLKRGGTMHVWFQGWGHGLAILETLHQLFERPTWQAYADNFKLSRFLITPQFCQPWFILCQLHVNQIQLVEEIIDLPGRGIFLQWLHFNWPDYWGLIPAFALPRFNQEFLELYPLKTPQGYQVQVVSLVIDATKE